MWRPWLLLRLGWPLQEHGRTAPSGHRQPSVKPSPRTQLAARFWPDVLDSSARASLRSAIWSLRRALGEAGAAHLVATRDRVGLDDVEVDVHAVDALVRDGKLEEAAAIGEGELLPG